MSAIDDLIAQIPDENLRKRIGDEVDNLKKTKNFGLVFERHNPEVTLLYDVPVKKYSLVAKKLGKLDELFRVLQIDGDNAFCQNISGELFKFQLNELISVAKFGEPIYPGLKMLDEISNAPDSDLWHTLIEAENFHALQLLQYICADRKVDCIYIDPPYNTGAKDWKYNNDFVDSNDNFRHSKWLSMMEKRLILAKDILSDKGAIFISIDDNEQATLKLLCDKIFAPHNFVANIIWEKKYSPQNDSKYLSDSHDFILVYAKNKSLWRPKLLPRTVEMNARYKNPDNDPRGVWKPSPLHAKSGTNTDSYTFPNGVIWRPPLGTFWRYSGSTLKILYDDNKLYFGKDGKSVPQFKRFLSEVQQGLVSKTIWKREEVGDNQEAKTEIKSMKINFDTPKPVRLIKRILQIATDKNSWVVDFFAGSGTTLHAVNLLNAEDGGRRRCIMVTNNEVGESEEKRLKSLGLEPCDEEWKKLGIARQVTWRRTVCSIKGENINGEPLKGNYLGSEIPMSDGFKANANFFKLGFLDKTAVALGLQFKEILPLIWLKAGGYGRCPTVDEKNLPPMMVLPENKFAVLLEEKYFMSFEEKILPLKEIETIYIATDSSDNYVAMIQSFRDRQTYQLYRNYLENFKINLRIDNES